MWILSALSFAKSNWKLIAILLAVGLVWVSGYAHGEASVQADWDAVELAKNKQIIAERTRLEGVINTIAANMEAKLAQFREYNRRLNALLDNELKNPAYACLVPASGVQLIGKACAARNSPS